MNQEVEFNRNGRVKNAGKAKGTVKKLTEIVIY